MIKWNDANDEEHLLMAATCLRVLKTYQNSEHFEATKEVLKKNLNMYYQDYIKEIDPSDLTPNQIKFKEKYIEYRDNP